MEKVSFHSLIVNILFSGGGDPSPESTWAVNDLISLLNKELNLNTNLSLEEDMSNLSDIEELFKSIPYISVDIYTAVIDNCDGEYSSVYYFSENELRRAHKNDSICSEITIIQTVFNSDTYKRALFSRYKEELLDICSDYISNTKMYNVAGTYEFGLTVYYDNFKELDKSFIKEITEYANKNKAFSISIKHL